MPELGNLGKKAFALPIAICVILVCVLGLAIAPILSASPKNVPFAIVSLDKGAVTFAGSTNIGQTMVDNITAGESPFAAAEDADGAASAMQDAIAFTQLGSEEEARAALEANQYYGAIIIPENFTSAQMMSVVGVGEPPALKVLFNQAKNPMIANTMQTTISSAMLQAGIVVDTEMINEADIGGGTMSGMMAVQMLCMPLMMMVMLPSIITSLLTWPRSETLTRREKARRAGIQVAFLIVLAGVVAALALCVSLFGGLDLPYGRILPFLWAACFCMMLAAVALTNLMLPLGILCIVTVFALGMSSAMLPGEMLPEFWAQWVYPWAPQAALGEGLRSIIYMGNGPFEVGMTRFAIIGAIGLIAQIAAVFAPAFNPADMHEKMAAKMAAKSAARASK